MRRFSILAAGLLAGILAEPVRAASIITVTNDVTLTDYCDTVLPAPCPADPNSDTNNFTITFSGLAPVIAGDGFALTLSGVGDHDTEFGAEQESIAITLDDSLSLGTILDRNADNDLFDNRGFRSASFCCNIDGALDNDLFEMTAPLASSLVQPLLADGVLTVRVTFGSGVDNPADYTEFLSVAFAYDAPFAVPNPATAGLLALCAVTLAGTRRLG